ncbi:MAG: sigma 54-interacting transcriptional regulator [Deltaproteobacteria bacterium]|nr:sigma 54-interacting transcriptional regulator [Deltaproteobacteria bacterium]
MKRILVVDESPAVRETLGIILGRDFAIVQRALLPNDSLSFDEEVDLLILGIPPGLASDSAVFFSIACQVPCPVLFLVDSRTKKELGQGTGRIDCLVKPFNPFELKERVERLLAQSPIPTKPSTLLSLGRKHFGHYLEFPYLSQTTSALAKKFAVTTLPIMIIGEAGCGQEQVARAIYSLNDKAGPWISVYSSEITRDYLARQIAQLSRGEDEAPRRLTLFLNGLADLQPSVQSALLGFLEDQEEKGRQYWILSSSSEDLLEKVYRGEFLGPLYYRLALLTLRLPPLRERRNDLPSLAARLAQEYGARLDIGTVSFSPDAIERLGNYLWFGNLKELETVIARTLAIHRKAVIAASDLVLGIEEEGQAVMMPPVPEAKPAPEKSGEKQSASIPPPEAKSPPVVSRPTNGHSPDIRVLINELAHELKNPMVTIKTFAQLLGDRFDDAAFRVRFQETVGNDIERMDELLEAMLDFSRFTHPAVERIPLYKQLRRVLEEIVPECIKRGATIRWGRTAEAGEIFADEAQFRYAFRNVLRTVLAQLKPRGEIQIDVEGEGRVAVSYAPEGGRIGPFVQYLDISSSGLEEETLPLRILFAKILLERNGGGIKVSHLDGGRIMIRAELPVA